MWNTGRLWCRRQLYIEILHSQYRRVHLCTVLRIKPGLFTQLNFVQHRNTGQVRSNECRFNTRIWDYCTFPLLCSSRGSLSAGTAAAALVGGLDWIQQPLVLDKFRFVAPAFAQTSSSLAHRQTELLCTWLAAVYCCSAQAIWCGFWILSRQIYVFCMAYTLWKVLLLTLCALLLKILLLAGQVWGGTCCAPNPLFGTGQFNGI